MRLTPEESRLRAQSLGDQRHQNHPFKGMRKAVPSQDDAEHHGGARVTFGA